MIIDSPIISGSYAASGSLNQIGNVTITGSLTVTGDITGTALTATSASYALTASHATNVPQTASFADNATSASYAVTASYISGSGGGVGFPFSGSAVITGSLLITELSGSGTKYVITDNNGLLSISSGSTAIKVTETITSTADQTSFTVPNGYTTGLVDVFINGIKLNDSEFTDSDGVTITLATGSNNGDIVEFAKYQPANGVTNNALRQQTTFIADAGQTVFSASYTPGLLDIFYNGSRLSNSDYTANNGTYFTLATASAANDILDVFVYSYQVGAFNGIGGTGVTSQIAYFNTTSSITGSNNFTINGSTMTVTGSLLVSGSGTFTNIGPAVMSGSLNVSGAITTNSTITATTLVVQTVTSSNSQISGSTKFGTLISDTHQFTGSLDVSGSTTFKGNVTLSNPSTPLLQLVDTTNSKSLLIGVDDDNTFIRSSTSTPILFQVNGGDSALTLSSAGAATFSNSVTAGGYLANSSTTIGTPIDTGGTKAYFDASSINGAALTLRADSVGRTLRLTNDGSGSTVGAIDVNTTGLGISTNTSHPIVFSPQATERMRITPGGQLLLGTSVTTSGISSFDLLTLGKSGSSSTGILFSNGSSSIWGFIYNSASKIVLGSSSDLTFETGGSYTERLRITSGGTVQPGANGTQDLGTSSLRWATVYTSDLDMSNGVGDYTIVEGEEDLFLYNNKTNKVFKFVIQEVDPSEATPKMKR